jgi:hypothetical protein
MWFFIGYFPWKRINHFLQYTDTETALAVFQFCLIKLKLILVLTYKTRDPDPDKENRSPNRWSRKGKGGKDRREMTDDRCK